MSRVISGLGESGYSGIDAWSEILLDADYIAPSLPHDTGVTDITLKQHMFFRLSLIMQESANNELYGIVIFDGTTIASEESEYGVRLLATKEFVAGQGVVRFEAWIDPVTKTVWINYETTGTNKTFIQFKLEGLNIVRG